MDKEYIYKDRVICQIFPKQEKGRFAIVYTPNEYLICFAPDGEDINKSIDVAIQEIKDFIHDKITESQFCERLNERQTIMRGIIHNMNIPINGDLYNTVLKFFGDKAETGYKVTL